MVDHLGKNALGQKADTGKADIYILHPMSAALVRSADIHPVHKIMQHGGRQLLQVGIFLRPEYELLNAVGFVFLPGDLLLQKNCIFSVSSACSFS